MSNSVRALYEEMQLINPAPVIEDPKALSKEEREIRVQEALSRKEALVTLAEQKKLLSALFYIEGCNQVNLFERGKTRIVNYMMCIQPEIFLRTSIQN